MELRRKNDQRKKMEAQFFILLNDPKIVHAHAPRNHKVMKQPYKGGEAL